MASRPVLMDTSFVIAIDNLDDRHHDRADALAESLKTSRTQIAPHSGILLEIADGCARTKR